MLVSALLPLRSGALRELLNHPGPRLVINKMELIAAPASGRSWGAAVRTSRLTADVC